MQKRSDNRTKLNRKWCQIDNFATVLDQNSEIWYDLFVERSISIMGNDLERLHQEDLQRIRGFRLIDDDFMNACFDNNIEGTELVLRIILNRNDISVKSVKTQKLMKNL